MGYIYKITNLVSRKVYIGETVQEDPYLRWKGHQDAFRRGTGCPALRDAVQKYGIENFTFEVIIICFDDARFDMEREYIKKYNSMVPNGYNILEGGLGGAGFRGKKHSAEVCVILSKFGKKRAEDPKYREILSMRCKEQMKKVKEAGVNWGEKVRNSEKYKKAFEERRVGAFGREGGKHSEESKKKTSESLKKYFAEHGANIINTEKHRKSMAKAVGVKVLQFDLGNNYIATYESISDAARQVGISKGAIQFCLTGKHKKAGGFMWKRDINNPNDSKIEHI